MLGESELETAVAFVRFESSFAQRGLTVAALDCDQHLEPTSGGSGRVQLCRFACNRVRLAQLSLKEKNTSEVVLRRKGKRIQFHGLPSLFLSLIRFTQINDDSRQQIIRRRIRGRKFFGAF